MSAIAEKKVFKAIKKNYTLNEYLIREERSDVKHEFINGTIIKMPGAKAKHNQIAAQISSAILNKVEKLPFLVYNSDMKIYIADYNHAVYPDAVVVCEVPEYWNGREDIIINPILIVEVLSDSTEKYDRGDKFMKYKTLSSFKEYVMVRQDKCHVESWYKVENNLWRETIENDLSKNIFLESIQSAIELSKIYRQISF